MTWRQNVNFALVFYTWISTQHRNECYSYNVRWWIRYTHRTFNVCFFLDFCCEHCDFAVDENATARRALYIIILFVVIIISFRLYLNLHWIINLAYEFLAACWYNSWAKAANIPCSIEFFYARKLPWTFTATRQYPWHKRNGGLDSSRWSQKCLCKNVLQFTPSAFRNRAAILSMFSRCVFFLLFCCSLKNISLVCGFKWKTCQRSWRSEAFSRGMHIAHMDSRLDFSALPFSHSLIFISIHMKFNGQIVNKRMNGRIPIWTLVHNVDRI